MLAEKLSNETSLEVKVCEGAACGSDEKTVRATLDLQPARRATFTLMAGFSASYGGVAARGLGVMAPAVFEPIGGAEGPDQVFALTQQPDLKSLWSAEVMLAVRLHKFSLMFGPSLLVSGGLPLTQWNVRVGYQLAGSLHLLFGPSVRVVPIPTDFAAGARVSVPRGAGDPSPPRFRAHDELAILLSVSVGLDLEVLGDAATGLVNAIGGTK